MDIEADATDTTREGPHAQARQYIELGWEQVDNARRDELLLLYTRGARSGDLRRTPLFYYFDDGSSVVVVGNNGGRNHHPDWYFNLTEDPHVWIRNKDDFHEGEASTIEGEERSMLWAELTESRPHLAESQANIERIIPLVRLTRNRKATPG